MTPRRLRVQMANQDPSSLQACRRRSIATLSQRERVTIALQRRRRVLQVRPMWLVCLPTVTQAQAHDQPRHLRSLTRTPERLVNRRLRRLVAYWRLAAATRRRYAHTHTYTRLAAATRCGGQAGQHTRRNAPQVECVEHHTLSHTLQRLVCDLDRVTLNNAGNGVLCHGWEERQAMTWKRHLARTRRKQILLLVASWGAHCSGECVHVCDSHIESSNSAPSMDPHRSSVRVHLHGRQSA